MQAVGRAGDWVSAVGNQAVPVLFMATAVARFTCNR
jgi:hypothetical protein